MTHSAVEATLLLTDIEESTALAQALGDDWVPSLEQHNALVRDVLARHGGTEARNQGDSFFVVFDRPLNAVRAAIEVQRALASADWPHGHALKVRMGLHLGEVIALDNDYAGVSIHLAARIMGAAHGGQVVLSEAVVDAVGETSEFACVNLGGRYLKDFTEPVGLYQLSAPGLAESFPPLVTIDARDHNLPSMLTRFVGRQDELADLRGLLSGDARLVSVSGPGGVGKTRLALEAAWSVLSRFRAGAWFVDFASEHDPARIIETIAETLGVHAREEQSQLDALVASLSTAPALLLLDNLEHLVSGSPAIADLLRRCPSLVALVTTRERLRLQGEHEVVLDGLADDAAVELFANRALLARRDVAEDEAVVELCRRVDNLPLAIELAAARLHTHTVAELVAAMDNMLDVLNEGERDRPTRHQALRAMIAVSVDALTEAERSVFRGFSVFAGGATLDAVRNVCMPKADEVSSLADKSLLRSVYGRFTMLEPVRQFAEERLAYDAPGERDLRVDAHARYFLDMAERCEPELVTANQLAALDELAADHANLRLAIDRGKGDTPLRIAAALTRFWRYRGYPTEGRATLARLLDREAEPSVRARVLLGAAELAVLQHDLDSGQSLAKRAIEVGGSSAVAHTVVGDIARLRGDIDEALTQFLEAMHLAEAACDDRGLGIAYSNLGVVSLLRGDLDDAAERCRAAIAISETVGDLQTAIRAQSNLGLVFRNLGDADKAIEAFKRSLELSRLLHNRGAEAIALQNLAGAMQARTGLLDVDQEAVARDALNEAIAIYDQLGYRRELASALMAIPAVADDPDECMTALRRARGLFAELGDSNGVDWANSTIAAVLENRC